MLQMEKMGGMSGMVEKLPGAGKLAAMANQETTNGQVKRMVAIINSMTPQERRFPDLIKGSRKRRIANGAGLQIQDVNRLLKQHKQMSKMMKKMSGGGLKKMMRGMKGQLPPGMGGGFPG